MSVVLITITVCASTYVLIAVCHLVIPHRCDRRDRVLDALSDTVARTYGWRR